MSAKNDQANMSLVGHLREIRNRIALSVTALVVAFIACFAIIKPLANAMLQMGLDAGFQYVYLSPSELLTSYFKLALVLAIVVVSPLLVFEIWGFVAAGAHPKRKAGDQARAAGRLLLLSRARCSATWSPCRS